MELLQRILGKSKRQIQRDRRKRQKEKAKKKSLIQNIKRDIDRIGVVGMLTRFPIMTVTFFLMLTVYLALFSGFVDINEEAPMPWQYKEEPSLNVNGDLEVYLPDDDDPNSVKNQIADIKEDWSTNVMIIYVESGKDNITERDILIQMDLVESALNSVPSDDGVEDDVF